MAKSPSLAEALEGCRNRLAHGSSVEECLAAYPAHAEELATLLPLVLRAQALQQQPDPAFAAAARQRFLHRVRAEREALVTRPVAAPFLWLRRLAVPVALVLLLALSGVGLVRVSADALPDSPLYPVQQVSQQVQRRFQGTPAEQAVFDMQLAQQRLQQLQRAEALGKDATTLDRIATAMVQATSRAATEIAQTKGDVHEQLVARMAPLLAREVQALREQARNESQTTTVSVSRLQAQVESVQTRVQQATPLASASPSARATAARRATPPVLATKPGQRLRERLRQWWIMRHQQRPSTDATPCPTPSSSSAACSRAPVHATPTPRLSS